MLLDLAQRMLNEQIRASTAARERLKEVEGKRFAVVVRDSDLRVVTEAREDGLALRFDTETVCDVELTAGTTDLLRLARSSGLTELRNVGATINGDVRVAEAFAALFRLAMPEPEGVLADWIGDVPAHALGEAARAVGGWGIRAARAFEQNLGEYLQEETPTLVPAPLARSFTADVDRIVDDVARAERRVELLERRRRGGPARGATQDRKAGRAPDRDRSPEPGAR